MKTSVEIVQRDEVREALNPKRQISLSLVTDGASWQGTKGAMVEALVRHAVADDGPVECVAYINARVHYQRIQGMLDGYDERAAELVFSDGLRIVMDDLLAIHI